MIGGYKYYKENDKLMRLHIEWDDNALNPRKDDDFDIGNIVCWGKNWGHLSDEGNDWEDEEDFFKEICMKHLTKEQIETLVDKRMKIVSIEPPTEKEPDKAEYERDIRDMCSKYDEMSEKAKELGLQNDQTRYINMARLYRENKEKEFKKKEELSKTYKVKNDIGLFPCKGTKKECEEYINGELREGLLDGDIFYASAGMYKETMEMLQNSDIVILPVFVYEHGGISISVSDFCDGWDSGQAGWIYATKEDAYKMIMWGARYKDTNGNLVDVTEENWKKATIEELKSEIKIYDQYLQDEVYGIVTEEYNPEDDSWEEVDSCWGFFSDKWGDELIESIASDFGISEPLYDDEKAILQIG